MRAEQSENKYGGVKTRQQMNGAKVEFTHDSLDELRKEKQETKKREAAKQSGLRETATTRGILQERRGGQEKTRNPENLWCLPERTQQPQQVGAPSHAFVEMAKRKFSDTDIEDEGNENIGLDVPALVDEMDGLVGIHAVRVLQEMVKENHEADKLEDEKVNSSITRNHRSEEFKEKLLKIYDLFLRSGKIDRERVKKELAKNQTGTTKPKKQQFTKSEEAFDRAIVDLLAYQYAMNQPGLLPSYRRDIQTCMGSDEKALAFCEFVDLINDRHKKKHNGKEGLKRKPRNYCRQFNKKLRLGTWYGQGGLMEEHLQGVYLPHYLVMVQIDPRLQGMEKVLLNGRERKLTPLDDGDGAKENRKENQVADGIGSRPHIEGRSVIAKPMSMLL